MKSTPRGPTPTGGNPITTQIGIDQRNRIVELIAQNYDNDGDGMTRTELAAELGISKPALHRHLTVLFDAQRIDQIGKQVVPLTGHVHICRTCGKTMH